jgi:hypothetical protein
VAEEDQDDFALHNTRLGSKEKAAENGYLSFGIGYFLSFNIQRPDCQSTVANTQ